MHPAKRTPELRLESHSLQASTVNRRRSMVRAKYRLPIRPCGMWLNTLWNCGITRTTTMPSARASSIVTAVYPCSCMVLVNSDVVERGLILQSKIKCVPRKNSLKIPALTRRQRPASSAGIARIQTRASSRGAFTARAARAPHAHTQYDSVSRSIGPEFGITGASGRVGKAVCPTEGECDAKLIAIATLRERLLARGPPNRRRVPLGQLSLPFPKMRLV
jgi:hypothetical protein